MRTSWPGAIGESSWLVPRPCLYIVLLCHRFSDLKGMSSQLEEERYWKAEQIKEREVMIMNRWQELLKLLEVHRDKLERYSTLISLQREIDTLATTIK